MKATTPICSCSTNHRQVKVVDPRQVPTGLGSECNKLLLLISNQCLFTTSQRDLELQVRHHAARVTAGPVTHTAPRAARILARNPLRQVRKIANGNLMQHTRCYAACHHLPQAVSQAGAVGIVRGTVQEPAKPTPRSSIAHCLSCPGRCYLL